jgi:hypothetical protein
VSARSPEKPPAVGPKPPTEASTLRPACGHPTDDGPCQVAILLADGRCYRHSSLVTREEELASRRLGGRRATARPDKADVSPVRFRSQAEVAQAREEVFALVKGKALTASSGTTLLMALRDADTSRDKAEQREIDRKGRRPQHAQLVVILRKPWEIEHRRAPGLALPSGVTINATPVPAKIKRRQRRTVQREPST